MSLINQVLKDLDSREPMQQKPGSVDYTPENAGVALAPESSRDWLGLLIWGGTVTIVVSTLAYLYLFQEKPVQVSYEPKRPAVNTLAPASETETATSVTAIAVPEAVQAVVTEVVEPAKTVVPKVIETVTPEVVKEEKARTEIIKPPAEKIAYLPLNDVPVEVARPKTVKQKTVKKDEKRVLVKKSVAPIDEARAMLNDGRLLEAEAKLKQLLKQKPSNVVARELLIGLLDRSGRTAELEKQLEVALRFYPNRESLVLLKARSELQNKKAEMAIERLERLMLKKKAGLQTITMLAPLYQQTSQYEKSVTLYQQLVKKKPANATYWVGMGIGLEALGKNKPAIKSYSNALQLTGLDYSLQQYAQQRLLALQSQDFTHE